MKLSEWKLKLTENVESRLQSIRNIADRVSDKMGGLQNKLNNVGSGISNKFSQMRMKLSDFGDKFGDVTNQIPLLGRALSLLSNPIVLVTGLLIGLGVALASTVSIAASFQDQVAEFSALTGTIGGDLDAVKAKSLELSMQTGKSANEIVNAYKLVASNIAPELQTQSDLIDEIAKNSITLQKASGDSLENSVMAVVGTLNSFNLEATDTARIMNVLAAGAKIGSAEVPHLTESMKQVGVTASGAQIKLEETVGALETLGRVMIKGSEAGIDLRNVILFLQTREIPGMNVRVDGLANSLDKLKPYLNDTAYLTELFGIQNVNSARHLIQNTDMIREYTAAVTGTNMALEQAAIRENTYNAAKEKMRASWDALKIKIGEQFLPVLTKVANGFTMLFTWIQSNGSAIMETLGTIFKPFITIGKIAFDVIESLVWAIGTLWEKLSGVRNALQKVWDHLYGFFKNLVDLVSGIFVHIAEIVNPINWFRKGKVKDSIAELKSTFQNFGIAAGNGFVEGLESEIIPGIAGLSNAKMGGTVNAALGAHGNLKTLGASDKGGVELRKGLDQVTGGGKTIRNVTVTIHKMVEGGINITTSTVKEGAADMSRMIEEYLLRSVHGAELAMANE